MAGLGVMQIGAGVDVLLVGKAKNKQFLNKNMKKNRCNGLGVRK
jgi:hypothetical protein